MKVELELTKNIEGKHFLQVNIATPNGEVLTSVIPMELDPLYVLYKKVSSEFHYFDAVMNQEGHDFVKQQAENAAQEQNPVPTESPQTPETH